ncbi:MAG: ABC transporter substrate-binding protein [Rhodoglobus sp.]
MRNHRSLGSPAVAAIAVTAFFLTACSTDPDTSSTDSSVVEGSYPLTIENCGDELTIDSEPMSILSIGTSALSLLDAAGAAGRITSRSGEFGAALPVDLKTDLSAVPIVDPSDPSTEKIVGANTDVVVGYGLFNSTDEDLAAADVTNIVIDGECSHDAALTDATDFEAIFADIERLGSVFGTGDVAAQNVAALRTELDELGTNSETADPQSAAVVYYFSSASPLSARGGQGIANDILDRANLTNVYGKEASVYVETNIETLLDADPEVIVLAYGLHGESFDTAKAQLIAEPGAGDLTAIKNNAVVGVLASELAPDPGAIRGLRSLLESMTALNR